MRIAIVTSFLEMSDHYSLTSIVKSQLRMILDNGHQAVLITREEFSWKHEKGFEDVVVRPVIPSHNQVDYQSERDLSTIHKEFIPLISRNLMNATLDCDAVFT